MSTVFLKSIGMTDENQNHYKERFVKLANHFKQLNLKIRSDSELCKAYIMGTSKLSVEEIGHIMGELDFFYNQTRYRYSLLKNRRQFFAQKYADPRNWDDDVEPCGYCDNGCEMCYDGLRFCSTTIEEEAMVQEQTKNEELIKFMEHHEYNELPDFIKERYYRLYPCTLTKNVMQK